MQTNMGSRWTPEHVNSSLSATCGSESNSYWMGSGTTHTEILLMFYTSVKLKSLPGNYDRTQYNLVWIFRNFTNIFFHDVYMDVTFMTAEKWVVPYPIQYELLSL
jgi:hypothetical protein